jgi:hypothetical protein
MNMHLNNTGQECKTRPVQGQVLVRVERGMEKSMYFTYLYEEKNIESCRNCFSGGGG